MSDFTRHVPNMLTVDEQLFLIRMAHTAKMTFLVFGMGNQLAERAEKVAKELEDRLELLNRITSQEPADEEINETIEAANRLEDAAPVLLEACKAALNFIENVYPTARMDIKLALRKAISEAEG